MCDVSDEEDTFYSAPQATTNDSSQNKEQISSQVSDNGQRLDSFDGEKHQNAQNSSSTESIATGTNVTADKAETKYHRYYHVFKEGELLKLINSFVPELKPISSFYDHANWVVVAEKVDLNPPDNNKP